jgi:fatty acid desaturase
MASNRICSVPSQNINSRIYLRPYGSLQTHLLHHIHHLRSRIPNYNLQRACNDTQAFLDIEPLTIRKSLTSLHLKLWDEQRQKLVGFKSAYA